MQRLTIKLSESVPYTDAECVSEMSFSLNPEVRLEDIRDMIADLRNRVDKDVEAELFRRNIVLDANGKRVR